MKNFYPSIFLICLMLLSCSAKKNKKEVVDKSLVTENLENITMPKELIPEIEIETNSYQLGDSWDRSRTQAFHRNHFTVLRALVNSEEGRVSSNFILLYKINNTEALFAGTVHSFSSPCGEEGIDFKTQGQTFKAECTDIFSIVPETDVVIFSVRFLHSEDLNQLIPAQIFDKDFVFGERLRFFGIELDDYIPGYYPLITDSSKDCRLISSAEEQIFDPDSLNTIVDEKYWSYAVTCDVKHGDSGGMFVNRDGDLVGILWTGAFPKKEKYGSSAILDYINKEDIGIKESLWSDFNYITPAYRIFKHLEKIKLTDL